MSIPAGPNKMPPVHPGEILQEELAYLGLTARQFSLALNVPPNRISAILHGQRGITVDTALRLARYFGTSPEMWLRLQMDYDLKRTQQADGARIAREVSPRAMASQYTFSQRLDERAPLYRLQFSEAKRSSPLPIPPDPAYGAARRTGVAQRM